MSESSEHDTRTPTQRLKALTLYRPTMDLDIYGFRDLVLDLHHASVGVLGYIENLESELSAAKAENAEFRKQLESNDFWGGIILSEDGFLDVEQVKKELEAKDAEIVKLKQEIESGDYVAGCRDEVIEEQRLEIQRLRGTIGSMMGACGLIDPVEGCRTAIEWGNEALSGDANKKASTCRWSIAEPDEGKWDTNCEHSFFFAEGGADDNMFRHCPFCGRRIEVVNKKDGDA